MNVTRNVRIPAAIGSVEGVYAEQAAWARWLICLSASGPFKAAFGQQQYFDVGVGVSRDAGDDGIGTLTLSNNTGALVTATIVLSDGRHEAPPTLLTSSFLVADTQCQTAIAALASFTYAGTRTINGVSRQRKFLEVDVTAAGAGNSITLEDSAGNRLALIPNGGNRRFEISADLVLHNTNGSTATLSVYEVF